MAKIKGTVELLEKESERLGNECTRLTTRCEELTALNAATELGAATMLQQVSSSARTSKSRALVHPVLPHNHRGGPVHPRGPCLDSVRFSPTLSPITCPHAWP